MDYYDRDEDSPPTISPPVSPLIRNHQSDNDEDSAKHYMDKFKNDRSSKLIESKLNEKKTNKNSLFF
jgi:hypothetical protein